MGHAVELIGKVDGNLAIKVQAATDFGTGVGKCFVFGSWWLDTDCGRFQCCECGGRGYTSSQGDFL